MKRPTDYIIVFLAITICLIILFTSKCVQCEDYIVANYMGGINVATDSTDLAPNQALDLTNLVFDMPNVLTGRQGYSYWNATAFDGSESDDVKGIIIYNDKIISVVGINIYTNTSHFQWTGDSIAVFNDSNRAYTLENDWLYMKIGYGDSIILSGVKYAISGVATTDDSTIMLATAYAGSTDSLSSYVVRNTFPDFTSFIENDNILYILSDNIYDGFPMVFNDTTLKYLAVIDSGIISTAIDLDTSSFVASGTRVASIIYPGRRIVFYDSLTGTGIEIGDIFHYYYDYYCKGQRYGPQSFFSKITNIDTTTNIQDWIEIEDVFRIPCDIGNNVYFDNDRWEIRREQSVSVVDSNYVGLADGNKNWRDIEFGELLYTGFFAVTSDSGYGAIKTILNNDDTTLVVMGAVNESVYYYIMPGVPTFLFRESAEIDSIYKEQARLKQMIFYKNQWYGIGQYEYLGPYTGFPNPFGNPIVYEYYPGYNRVWYSHPYFYGYSSWRYNFDLGSDDVASVLFTLRDRLFIGTTTGIWSSVGSPATVKSGGDQIYDKIVSNQGIPDLDNWAKATEEYGYFTNRTGIYRFDGIRPEKISHLIDPIIENNYNSDIVMVYRNPDLYISFTDSNFTLVYDERFNSFTKLDFGMTCAYAPPDTDIIYFGLNGQPGRVYYYPNGEYWDRNSATDSAAIEIVYKSGWQTFLPNGGFWTNKDIEQVYWPLLSPDTATISIYSDFSDSTDDQVTADSSGRFVYRKNPDNDANGEYFQLAIKDTVSSQIIIGGYKIVWGEATQWKK